MTKMIASWVALVVLVVLVGSAGAAFAQTAGAAPAGGAAEGAASAPPTGGDAQPAADMPPAPSAAEARKLCAAAMNADPAFAAEIVKIADEAAAQKRDAETVAAHNDANLHIQKNERHVIYAYAAMWIVAAAFVIFLWRRQLALKTEIASLRRDLEAAADEARPTEGRP